MPDKKLMYGLQWDIDRPEIEIEMTMIVKGGEFKDSKDRTCGKGLFHHYQRLQNILWPDEDNHKWSELILSEILNNTITVLAGAASCVSGDTRILDPQTGEEPTIEQLYRRQISPTVMTMLGKKKASIPFIKGIADLYEIVLENGSRFTATAEHRVLTDSGFVHVSQLQSGQYLSSYEPIPQVSNSEHDPLIQRQDEPSSQRRVEDFQGDYHPSLRFCGERPLWRVENGQSFSPLPNDALKCKEYAYENSDALDNKSLRSRLYRRVCHLSSCSVARLSKLFQISSLRHFFSEIRQREFGLFQPFYRYGLSCDLLQTCLKPFPCYGDKPNCNTSSLNKAAPSFLANNELSLQATKAFQQRQGHTLVLEEEQPSGQQQHRGQDSFYSLQDYKVSRSIVQSINFVRTDIFYDLQVPDAHHYFAEGAIHHNSGKTHEMAKFALADYWCFPNETLIIASSTDMRSLELRVWGDIKSLFQSAKERFPKLAGVVLDNKHTITTDDISEEGTKARDLRKGIICVPCKTASQGRTDISGYVGIKQKRRRYLADEFQFMENAMFDSLANVNSGDFKMICAGNPIGEDDPLDKISEPKCGWGSEGEITKTTVWENKMFLNSRTVNLVGIDSPNFPQEGKTPKYWYLINQDTIDRVLAGVPNGKDSWQYWSQCMGVRRAGQGAKRVVTQLICEAGKAFEDVIWDGNKALVWIAALDAAYGGTGGDRCPLQISCFGYNTDGKMILVPELPILVPISVSTGAEPPEEQIAKFCKAKCEERGIPPRNFFYDSTGRGSLGLPLARLWSDQVQPIEFGGFPSKMPVSLDFYVWDAEKRMRRLQTCDEHYSKKVSEIWYSVRYAIECQQIRKLPTEIADELYKRTWSVTNGNKVEVESKIKMKERIGRSPDLGDAFCLSVYGARMRGFIISKQAKVEASSVASSNVQLKKLGENYDKIRRKGELIQI